MKKGDRVSGVIERIDFPNKGIMNVDEERLVVKNGRLWFSVRTN